PGERKELVMKRLVILLAAALCALAMPFTYSIANGLAFGFIAYAALKAGTGRWREVHPAVWLVAVLFVLRYALE
ncbi:MAG: NCS2 family permease, partial [Stenotrophomonas maltophilia]